MTREIPPWMSHLRRDRRGLPVPYINLWGPANDVDKLSIRHDRNVGRPAVFMDDEGFDTPDFTSQNMQRQRECWTQGLCQVCARPVPWSRRWLVIAAMSVETITLHGRDIPVVTEPWLCQRCADFAITTCPDLIRRRRDERLTLIPVTSKREVALTNSIGWIEGPLEEKSKRIQPTMWVKAYLLHIQLIQGDQHHQVIAPSPERLQELARHVTLGLM